MGRKNVGRAEFFALPTMGSVAPLRRFASPPIPLYTPLLWRHIDRFMEVDFQAIKLEELKSRLGELRRYL
jgi:hypothetical protein